MSTRVSSVIYLGVVGGWGGGSVSICILVCTLSLFLVIYPFTSLFTFYLHRKPL